MRACIFVVLDRRLLTHRCGSRSDGFDLSANFPAANMLVRNPAGDTVRSLYMVNDIVKSIVQHNDFARIRLMTAGTKVFGKQEGTEAKRAGNETHFRVLAEGLPVVLPFVGPRAVVEADFAALKVLMESYYPLTTGFTDPFRSMIEAKGEHYSKHHSSSVTEYSATTMKRAGCMGYADFSRSIIENGSYVVRFQPGRLESGAT